MVTALTRLSFLSVLLFSGCGHDNRRQEGRATSLEEESASAEGAAASRLPPSIASDSNEVLLPIGPQSGARRTLDRPFRVTWVRKADVNDTILLQPADAAATERTLYISDFAGSRVFAIDASTGKLMWAFGRPGEGPGEFRGRVGFVGISHDTIQVWNWSLRRITVIDPNGQLARTIRLEAPAMSMTLCVLGDGQILSNKFVKHDAAMVATISRDGKELLRLDSLPWAELRSIPPIAAQYILRPLSDGTCVMAATYWSGVVVLDSNARVVDSLAMVEAVPIPSAILSKLSAREARAIDRRAPARPGVGSKVSDGSTSTTLEVAEMRDYIVLAMNGRTQMKGHLLDFYERKSGRYAGSLVTAGTIRRIAGSGSNLFLIAENEHGLFQLSAITFSSRP